MVKTAIYRLRQKIETEPDNPRYLLTVRGVGYTIHETWGVGRETCDLHAVTKL
jgi:DNA-binding response OmpR family regulator